MEMDDEWQTADRRYFGLGTMYELTHPEAFMEDLGLLRFAPILMKSEEILTVVNLEHVYLLNKRIF